MDNVIKAFPENQINLDHSSYCVVAGNTCTGSISMTELTDTCGIELGASHSWLVDDNLCYANISTGILIIACNRTIISGNQCFNNGQRADIPAVRRAGICIKTWDSEHKSSMYNVVIGNQCYDVQASPTQQYGIVEWDNDSGPAVVGNNYFQGNHCRGNERRNMLLNSSDSAAPGNWLGDSTTIRAAATITLPDSGEYFVIAGRTAVMSITASWEGRRVTFKFADAVTLRDGKNLLLAGSFSAARNDTITLICDGTNWVEVARGKLTRPKSGPPYQPS
jgi:hypothetical protein